MFGYTDLGYPTHSHLNTEVHVVNYYDSYGFLSTPIVSGKSLIGSFHLPNGSFQESQRVNGMLTGTLSRILGTESFLLNQSLYDEAGRISKEIIEHQLNGVDVTTTTYNFVDVPLTVTRQHYKDGSLQLTVGQQYTYDHAGRVIRVSEQINNQIPVLTSSNYNAIGQLETQKTGNNTVSYSYNARGWLYKASSPLFSLSLNYQRPTDHALAQYNGNISEQIWMTGTGRTPYRYSYSYDMLNRLLEGVNNEGYGETLSYDKMGNITHLARTGQPSITGGEGSFTYDYGVHGSQLQSVGSTGYNRNYQYNGMGSMVSDGQIKVSYNAIGMPKEVTDMADVPKIAYLYDAQGRKLRKTSATETRHYISGIEYVGTGLSAAIDLIHTKGGIARKSGTTFLHEFFLTDHLGNTRVVHNGSGTVLQQTDYLPFGMEINRKISSPKMPYTYNGKELQPDIGMYDYGARFYDAVIGRWNVVDPLAEEDRAWSVYNYVRNNPIRLIDPDGMKWVHGTSAGINYTSTSDPDDIEAFIRDLQQKEANEGMEGEGIPPNEYKYNYETGEYDYISSLGGNDYDVLHFEHSSFVVHNFEGGQRVAPGFWYKPGPMASGALTTVYPETYFIGATAGARTMGWLMGRLAATTGGRVFWSGGDIAKIAAMDFAKANGMKTLEMTMGGHIMNTIGPYLPRSISRPIWDGLSRNFARGASGNINVFQNAVGVSLKSTWRRIEYPILQKNNIFYHIVK